MESMSMKKMLSVLLVGAMTISLAACGSKTPNPPEVTPKTPSGSSSVSTPEDPTDDGVWRPFNEKGETIRTDRDATGENGMVASSNVYATMAGLEILEQGGNAVDAAIAVCYALGVAEPFTSGLGGGGFMIVHTADGENQFIDYREVASSGQTAESWLDDSGNLIENANSVGGLAVGVPGEVAGLELALSQFGSGKLSRQQIMQPAIDLANNGYVVSPTMYGAIADEYERMIGEYSELGQYYLKDGLPYEVGDTVTNPDLAKTLQLIAENGADAFYKGEVAEAIVAAVQKHGGVMTTEDLANYKAEERVPVTGTYRGYQIISAPPASSGGTHIVEALNVLENYDISGMEVNSAEYLHLFSETFKACFADRAAYMADTAFAEVPLDGLTSKDYAKTIYEKITDGSQDWAAGNPAQYEGNSTTSFSIADKEGNVVTVTQTIECFWGSKIAVEGYGFIMNDEMHDFSTSLDSVNKLEPGKRPLSSMSPTIVLREDGSSFMSVGSPGGLRIWPTVTQVISHVIDHNMDIQEAIDTARIFDNGTDTGINYESGGVTPVTADVAAALEAQGHAVTDKGEWQLFFGGVQGIVYQEDGTLRGGADPRRDGKALGF
jgi:gamma-glutamyltranspeptidase/glutathione hydrolase